MIKWIIDPLLDCLIHDSLIEGGGAQVTRLGKEETGFSRRELYLRNLSSHSLEGEMEEAEQVPEPSRVQGDVIAFRRSAFIVCLSSSLSLPLSASRVCS